MHSASHIPHVIFLPLFNKFSWNRNNHLVVAKFLDMLFILVLVERLYAWF